MKSNQIKQPSHRTRITNRMIGGVALAASAVALVGCGADVDEPDFTTQDQAIYYGTRTPTEVPMTSGEQLAIGYLATPSGAPFCSGTLIDRDVVVTASHCTEGESASGIRFGVGSPGSPSGFFQVQSIREHSSRDVALLFLAEDAVSRVPSIEPLPFLREALPQSWVGSWVEAAGYGETHDGSDGRYFARLTLIGMDDQFYDVDGNGQRGICFGDSGGPLLVEQDGYTVVAGVESNGDATCVDVDHLTRLDRVASWIDGENGSFDPNANPTSNPGTGGKPPATGGTPTTTPTTGGGAKPPAGGSPTSDPTGNPSPPSIPSPTGGPSSGPGTGGSDEGEDIESPSPGWGDVLGGCSASGTASGGNAWMFLGVLGLVAARARRRQ